MLGANDGEVSAVECRDLMHAETFSDRHQAGVNATESQVGVSLDELGIRPESVEVRASTVRSPLAIEP